MVKKTFFDLPYMKLGRKIVKDIFEAGEVNIDVTELVINRSYEFDHDLNVGILSALIGRTFGMSENNIYHLAMGGFLHDIGLLALPEDIMDKFGKDTMTPNDLMIYHRYPIMGYDMIKHNNVLNVITKSAVLQHKERYDGSGFPSRKSWNEISMAAKIIAVANAFEKLFFGRDPEIGQLKMFEIVKHMLVNAGSAFDPAVVSVFIKHLVIFSNGTMVKLNNGSVALVERQNPGQIARPVVRVLSGGDKWEEVDLMKSNILILDAEEF